MTILDHEKLDVYEKALDFFEVAHGIAEKLSRRRDLKDQLQRASGSIVNNTAEGAGEFRPTEKARFYRMARRSAIECAANLDQARRVKLIDDEERRAAREHVVVIVQALVKLIKSCQMRAQNDD